MTLCHAVTVLAVSTDITIGTVTFIVCDIACVVFIGCVVYHCYFQVLTLHCTEW
jgi:hypothetical protein